MPRMVTRATPRPDGRRLPPLPSTTPTTTTTLLPSKPSTMAVVFGSRGPSVTSSSSSFFHFPPAIRPSTPAPPVPSSPESLSVIGNVHRVAKTQLYNRPLEAHAESAYHPLFERIQSFLHDVAACAPPFGRARPSPTPILRLLGVPPTAVDLIRRHLEALTYGPLSSSVAKGVK